MFIGHFATFLHTGANIYHANNYWHYWKSDYDNFSSIDVATTCKRLHYLYQLFKKVLKLKMNF